MVLVWRKIYDLRSAIMNMPSSKYKICTKCQMWATCCRNIHSLDSAQTKLFGLRMLSFMIQGSEKISVIISFFLYPHESFSVFGGVIWKNSCRFRTFTWKPLSSFITQCNALLSWCWADQGFQLKTTHPTLYFQSHFSSNEEWLVAFVITFTLICVFSAILIDNT